MDSDCGSARVDTYALDPDASIPEPTGEEEKL
jgi:hypothetical protein